MSEPVFLTDFYWMHVRDDGIIEKLRQKPDGRRALYVHVLDECEWTKTFLLARFDGYEIVTVQIPPPGDGWTHTKDDETHAYWRRARS